MYACVVIGYCAVACLDFFDWGGPSGALSYAGVALNVSTHTHTRRNSINIPFLSPLPISTLITSVFKV